MQLKKISINIFLCLSIMINTIPYSNLPTVYAKTIESDTADYANREIIVTYKDSLSAEQTYRTLSKDTSTRVEEVDENL